MAGFYNRYVKSFSELAGPRTDLTKGVSGKSVAKIEWTPEADNAFRQIKAALKSTVTLAFPDPDAQLQLTTDASLTAARAVLHQIRKGNK